MISIVQIIYIDHRAIRRANRWARRGQTRPREHWHGERPERPLPSTDYLTCFLCNDWE